MPEREDEGPVLRTGRANHRRGGIADGGRLTLTGGALSFKPHRVNFDGGVALSIPLAEIDQTKPGGRPFELLITMRGGEQETFAVYKRGAWIADITAHRST
jgi:hypothetical protein